MRLLVVLLLLGSAGAQDLHALARDGRADDLRAAIAAGADPDARDAFGQTPLMYAVDHARLDAVRTLVREGADVDARSGAGWTALMYASRHDWEGWHLAALLLEHGADPRIRNADGRTALDLAVAQGGRSLGELLEAAELLHEAVAPRSLQAITSARAEGGFFAAAILDRHDAVLVRRSAGGAAVVVRLTDHDGVVRHLDEMRLIGRYVVEELALADPNEDGVPDVLLRGGCECGAGSWFHVLLDGASGAALSAEQASTWDLAPEQPPTHAYRFPSEAPGWMRTFLAGALAARGHGPASVVGAEFVHEVRYTRP